MPRLASSLHAQWSTPSESCVAAKWRRCALNLPAATERLPPHLRHPMPLQLQALAACAGSPILLEQVGFTSMILADCGRGPTGPSRYEWLPPHLVAGGESCGVSFRRSPELGSLMCCGLTLALLLVHKFRSVATLSSVLRKFDFLWSITELVVGANVPIEQHSALVLLAHRRRKLGICFAEVVAVARIRSRCSLPLALVLIYRRLLSVALVFFVLVSFVCVCFCLLLLSLAR